MSSPPPKTIGNRLAPPRFIMFALLFVLATGVAMMLGETAQHGVMLGFDAAALIFMLSLIPTFKASAADAMREHAAQNDANRIVLLVITGAVSAVIMAVVASELSGEINGAAKTKILGTLTLAWLFSNTVYALHYAHLWYSRDGNGGKDAGGVEFPKTEEPDYWDFVYFSFTLGMTFQTSDTDITSGRIRRLATAHSFIAFLFNLGVIAFTINVLGSGS